MTQGVNLPAQDITGSPRPKRRKPLPAHYFGPDPILTPDQFAQEMDEAAEGIYYVVTQGLQLGAFGHWFV